VYEPEDDMLTQTRITEENPIFSGGKAVSSGPPRGWKRFLTMGPNDYFPPGTYTARFRLAVRSLPEPSVPLGIIDVDVFRGNAILASAEIYPDHFQGEMNPKEFQLRFVNEKNQPLGFRVYDFGNAELFFDSVTVEGEVYRYRIVGSNPREVDLPLSDPVKRSWFPHEFLHLIGQVPIDAEAERGFSMTNRAGQTGLLCYGPYISLDPGKYRVEFGLKLEPGGEFRIDVAAEKGNRILVSDFVGGPSGEPGFTPHSLEFVLDQKTDDLEFRAEILKGRGAVDHVTLEKMTDL
jgi:hypothetical protein